MLVQPYLFYEGCAEEAIEFYRGAIGAKVETVMRIKDCPDPMPPGMYPPGCENKVMHAAFKVGDSVIMASDGMCSGKANFNGVSLSITAPDVAAADRMFAALSVGGQVKMPQSKTFFSPRFGMVADKFGVTWMIIVEAS